MGIYKSTRHFVVHRDPFGKVRAHPCIRGKHAGMRDDDRNKTYEGIVRSEYLTQVGDVPPFTGPVGVEICAFLPIAKSNINTKAKRKDWEDGKLLPTIKPDLDNVIKSI
ncbi:MAG: RusA family crossover junction endodeoxyribonuclease, partial [Mogibacterium sp.]|nr:RusA family crossover junction endodeoxyribonuclease [Mogibacterium sp.]